MTTLSFWTNSILIHFSFIFSCKIIYIFLTFTQYLASEFGGHGGGGEYEVQLGFGWSNGVILELLAKYGDRLSTSGLDN